MAGPDQKLLIISRDAILKVEAMASSELVFRQLANLNRRGFSLLLTASEPDHWVPTRGNVDNALQQQGHIQQRVQQAGGDLDGVYYVPRSLLTQDRNRTGALRDILRRYSAEPTQALLLSSSTPFLKAASRVGLQTHEIVTTRNGGNNLLALLKSI
jgi:histidinol phosphatase-like enzyme